MAGSWGLLPEQVWDVEAIPELKLFPGRPTGSAMPLVWAHAEFLKLLVARERGRPLELLDAVWDRYGGRRPSATMWHWRGASPVNHLPADRSLVIESGSPFSLHYGLDGWQGVQDRQSRPLGLGMHGVVLEVDSLASAAELNFTRYLSDESRWEGSDHRVLLTGFHPEPIRPSSI
jgi:glucoamylase